MKKLIIALIVVAAMAMSQFAVSTASANVILTMPHGHRICISSDEAIHAGTSGQVTVELVPPDCVPAGGF